MADVKSRLIPALEAMRQRYDKLLEEMNDPAAAANSTRIVALAKERARLDKIVSPYLKCRALEEQIAQARAMLDDPASDAEFKDLAAAEIKQLEPQAERLLERCQDLLIMSDKDEIESIILEIRAGTGGEEAALFAGDLLGMYSRYADKRRWKVEILSASGTDLGGYREVIVNLKGEGVYTFLSYEGGGHRVQRVPRTETQGRIHTSAATVAVLPEPEDVEVSINWEKDVLEHTSRAGGPGGQNVNKVESAIKLEHIATGITVSMRDEKSQHKNRAKARRILATRVYEHFRNQQIAVEAAARKAMVGSGDRSQRIRTYNFPQNRCTDHRLKGGDSEGANYNLSTILAGGLDDLLTALINQEKAQRLATL